MIVFILINWLLILRLILTTTLCEECLCLLFRLDLTLLKFTTRSLAARLHWVLSGCLRLSIVIGLNYMWGRDELIGRLVGQLRGSGCYWKSTRDICTWSLGISVLMVKLLLKFTLDTQSCWWIVILIYLYWVSEIMLLIDDNFIIILGRS